MRISAFLKVLALGSILIGAETKRPIGASNPTGMKNEQRTYSYPKREMSSMSRIV